jgi:hypothetical protein
MTNERVPYYGLECFGVRGDVFVRGRNADNTVAFLGCHATIRSDYAEYPSAFFLHIANGEAKAFTHCCCAAPNR